jgi:hypothetical protein
MPISGLMTLCGRVRPAQSDLLLRGRSYKELIRVAHTRKPLESYQRHGTAGTVIPCLAEIIIRSVEHRKGRIGHNRVAHGNAEGTNFFRRARTCIEKDHGTRINAFAFVRWNHVGVADAADGLNWAFGTDDDPTLIDQSLIQPTRPAFAWSSSRQASRGE